MFFFSTRNEIGKPTNAKNIEFCFFWSEKVFPLVSLQSKNYQIEAKQKILSKKSKKKVKKRKIDLNFALLRFAWKQKLLKRSEAKNLKRKEAKKEK